MLVFEERGKPENPEKNLSEQSREPTTNSTHIWCRVRESNPGHIGGRRALSPLRQPRSTLLQKGKNTTLSDFEINYKANVPGRRKHQFGVRIFKLFVTIEIVSYAWS